MRRFARTFLILAFVACSSPGGQPGAHVDDTGPQSTSLEGDSLMAAREGVTLEIVAVLDADTVMLRQRPESNELLWSRSGNGARQLWVSDSFETAYPVVSLQFVDSDSVPDLFYTVEHEEFVFGKLLQGAPELGRVLFQSSDRACRVPQLRDVTGDGRPEILHFEAGALAVEECAGDPYATMCQDRFPTEWVSVWTLQPDDSFSPDSPAAREFYSDIAVTYDVAADLLAGRLREAASSEEFPRCNALMVAELQRMAARARRIAEAD